MNPPGTLDSALEELVRISPEYADELSDHTPMVLEALDRLGASERIPHFLAKTLPKLRVWGSIEEPAIAGYPALLAEAQQALVRRGPKQVLAAWFPRFGPGLSGAAFHGVIRVAHALRALERSDSSQRRGELARALAYACIRAEFLPTLSAGRQGLRGLHDTLHMLSASNSALSPRSGLISTALAKRATEHPDLARATSELMLPADPDAAFRELRAAAIDLLLRGEYLPGNTFTMLHAITGMDACLTLGAALEAEQALEAMGHAAHALLAVRVAFVGAYPLQEARPMSPIALSDLVRRAIGSLDDHAIKLGAALIEADEVTERERATALELWLNRL